MPNQIQITNVTGVGPYTVQVCDVTNTTCITITGSTNIPPTFTFNVPPPFDNTTSLLVKIIDSTGCEIFHSYSAPLTPTPTPTPTLTPTPTPTYLCYCISVENITNQDGFFDYIDCSGNLVSSVLVQSGITYYTCGSNPFDEINVLTTVGGFCNQNQSCPTPSCTPTPTPTITPTVTPTITPTPSVPASLPFIATFNTTNTLPGSSGSNQLKLPFVNGGTYNCTVDWGDGNTDIITVWNDPATTHTYTTPGTYTIKIYGICVGWVYNYNNERNKILSITQWGPDFRLGNSGRYFFGCTNLVLNSVSDILNLSGTTNLRLTFAVCSVLTTVNNMELWDVSNVTDMTSMFAGSPSFNHPIGLWDVSNVITMENMFNTTSFNQPIGSWDVSNVTNMKNMFYLTPIFNQNISSWDVSSVTNMSGMFVGVTSFNQPLNSWNVSSVTNMNGMFASATSFNQPLNSWNVSNVTDMGSMFGGATTFNQPIGVWDVSSVIFMNNIFAGTTSFNQPLNSWNVSNVTNMSDAFQGSTNFNQPLNGWNVSNVTNMTNMFLNATSFNQNIGSWNVSGVTNMTDMLFNCGINTTNYDSLLCGWSSLPSLQPNVPLGASGRTYTILTAGPCRSILTGTWAWVIVGDTGI